RFEFFIGVPSAVAEDSEFGLFAPCFPVGLPGSQAPVQGDVADESEYARPSPVQRHVTRASVPEEHSTSEHFASVVQRFESQDMCSWHHKRGRGQQGNAVSAAELSPDNRSRPTCLCHRSLHYLLLFSPTFNCSDPPFDPHRKSRDPAVRSCSKPATFSNE